MCFGNHGVPYGLCNSLSTLRLTVTSFNARLGTGEWLILTRYRLIEDILVLSSLYKKHQALLDALIARICCAPVQPPLWGAGRDAPVEFAGSRALRARTSDSLADPRDSPRREAPRRTIRFTCRVRHPFKLTPSSETGSL